ncbi:MAG: M48 family metallopeptidase [Planctomycetota bacterium]
MATDFFERQSQSRTNTRWLVILFTVAVVVLVGAVVVVTAIATGVVQEGDQSFAATGELAAPGAEQLMPAFAAGGFTLLLILMGSLFKIAQLNGGGTTVAESLGGRRLFGNSADPYEQRLLNVVEEMALASGVPVPPVFLLKEEQGINAFAAGYSPSDAVIGVTRGATEGLTRDELQGVIAHEFSHILNGDMRMNIRLIGVLHGILLLALIGRAALRIAAHSGRGRRSSKDNGGGIVLAIVVVGLVTLILGSLGSFFGNLIKAAVSRQREYLADASAVQFTRNPGGIGGALKRIGGASMGSRLQHANAAEMSHMYFGQGVWEGFTGMMATHPPLPKRILAIEPNWDGSYPAPLTVAAVSAAGAAGFAGGPSRFAVSQEVVEKAADQVGEPTELHRRYVEELVGQLPPPVRDAAREPYGSRAVIYGLLLDADPSVRQAQWAALDRHAAPDVAELTRKLSPQIDTVDARSRLPLIDMALPSLRAMTPTQYKAFAAAFQKLIEADNRIGLFEWMLHRVLVRHLEPEFGEVRRPGIAYYRLQRLTKECSGLLSALAHSSGDAEEAFARGAAELSGVEVYLIGKDRAGLADLNEALTTLTRVAAGRRRELIDACAACICADDHVNVREAELLRGISDMLDCPMPPLVAGQTVSAANIPAVGMGRPS